MNISQSHYLIMQVVLNLSENIVCSLSGLELTDLQHWQGLCPGNERDEEAVQCVFSGYTSSIAAATLFTHSLLHFLPSSL